MDTRLTLGAFTPTELLDAMATVMPAEVMELYRSELSDFSDAAARMSITDGMLLILADPAGYLAKLRSEFENQGPPSGG